MRSSYTALDPYTIYENKIRNFNIKILSGTTENLVLQVICFFLHILATALQRIIMPLPQFVKVRKRRNRCNMRIFSYVFNSEHVIKPGEKGMYI